MFQKPHYERPEHNLGELKTKVLRAILRKYEARGGKVDIAFRVKHLDIDGNYKNFLISKIIMDEFTPDLVKVKHRNHARTVFVTQFHKRGEDRC